MSYKIINPPEDILMNDLGEWNARTLIDYNNHPAYTSLIDSAGLLLKIKAILIFLPSWIRIKLKRAIRYEMIPLHIRKKEGFKGKRAFVKEALSNLIKSKSLRNFAYLESSEDKLDHNLGKFGSAVIKLSDEFFSPIEELSKPNFEWLERRRSNNKDQEREFEESRSYASRVEYPDLFAAIEKIFQDTGILNTAESYLGRKVKLIDVNPQINDVSDNFWKKIFTDFEINPDSAYFHRDSSGGDIKVIFYMSNVDVQNGPFNYSLGTHRMPLTIRDDHISEANDSNGLSDTSLESRQLFSALPSVFQQKGAFGNDVLNNMPINRVLATSTWEITGNKGSIVMFDTKGVHRGGMVNSGERRVITCVLG